jgi:hypothetical protein
MLAATIVLCYADATFGATLVDKMKAHAECLEAKSLGRNVTGISRRTHLRTLRYVPEHLARPVLFATGVSN